ncbi:B-cell receptor-associated protein 31 [Tetranychus urticae]|uniref:Endoplasmic reticulum transmembrane protein n=1 Tax=Tetranychus urticae TaxID=32264 RepID=T1KL93_TETUR|nr:B-cell receptor-associated protein 31 [Tetranychus urticae]
MSLQWTLVATFLYIEIAIVIILLLPIISPRKWQSFFKSRFLQSIERQSNLYFTGFLLILVLLFLDSIREMRRYSVGREHDEHAGHLNTELAHSMKLFRAQRNFYIAGFALFLCLVIRRIASLLSQTAQLKNQLEAVTAQAKGASKAAEALLKASDDGNKKSKTKAGGDKAENKDEPTSPSAGELKRLRSELAGIKEELIKSKNELAKAEAVKKQAEGISREYDRLAEEHEKLIKKMGMAGDKKGD